MQSRQALETAIVRAAFDGHDAVHRITSQIRADDITDLPMRLVFCELVRLTDSGTPLDPVLVAQGLVTNSTVPDGIALETVVAGHPTDLVRTSNPPAAAQDDSGHENQDSPARTFYPG